ncbi:aromatic ring hydroxylase [Candidatus Curtissbacteria bacterium RBG_16_39_7]|uniref:Aromatic ring hydroxylase n=1 Tax=Candidatus Curtissbacteria bacterium RBG_16_39_7 TaxID=1797707 RepID=A0A1F5G1N3_9BACT|nr:MAG: aromatic ring hydroxylase [Candidatus Curtissbacteria bacterium RBG_16_39_7]
MITKEEILKKLKTILDPELGINIVDLGLIYDVSVNKNNHVKILMTLTTPLCPLSAYFQKSLEDKVKRISGVEKVKIDLTFDPPWNPLKITKEARTQFGL